MKFRTINIKGELFDLSQPVVMGILNITPDSFYANSRVESERAIIDRVRKMVDEGAAMIDVGAQSTNPKSNLLSCADEMERLKKALSIINREFPDIILSVDTFYSDAARMCVEDYGIAIINDISGGEIDPNMFETVARLNVPYILMHMKGTPQTMVKQTDYNDLMQDIFYYFSKKIAELHQLGVNDVIIDPGFGFSKTVDQNYELMTRLADFSVFDLPLLVGISRKRMIYDLLGINPEESLNGTTVLNTFAIEKGASILRVHDVRHAVETIKLMNKLRN